MDDDKILTDEEKDYFEELEEKMLEDFEEENEEKMAVSGRSVFEIQRIKNNKRRAK